MAYDHEGLMKIRSCTLANELGDEMTAAKTNLFHVDLYANALHSSLRPFSTPSAQHALVTVELCQNSCIVIPSTIHHAKVRALSKQISNHILTAYVTGVPNALAAARQCLSY